MCGLYFSENGCHSCDFNTNSKGIQNNARKEAGVCMYVRLPPCMSAYLHILAVCLSI